MATSKLAGIQGGKLQKYLTASLLILVFTGSIFASRENAIFSNVQKKVQETGIKTGETTFGVYLNYGLPSGDLVNVLNSAAGIELAVIKRNILIKDFHLLLRGSFNQYYGKFNSREYLGIIEAKLAGRYDFLIPEIPGVFFLEAGGGVAFENISVSGFAGDNIDPLYSFGAGYEFNVSEVFTFQGMVSYSLMPQKYVSGAARDGSFIKIHAGVNYNLETESRGGKKK